MQPMRVHARSVLCVVWLCAGCGDSQATGPASLTPAGDAGLDASVNEPAGDGAVDAPVELEPDAGGDAADAGDTSDASKPQPDAGAVQPSTELTYYDDMLPLFEQHCMPCHAPKGIGPFSLQQYANAYSNRNIIRFVTRTREMPPCDGAPSAQCGLSDDEIARIADWVNGGAPEGEAP